MSGSSTSDTGTTDQTAGITSSPEISGGLSGETTGNTATSMGSPSDMGPSTSGGMSSSGQPSSGGSPSSGSSAGLSGGSSSGGY